MLNSSDMALREDLILDINAHDDSWRKMGNFYGFLSVVLRLTIIVGSAVVASDAIKTWLGKPFPLVIPIISLLVAACAAIEAWVKPRDKWKGFMDVREHSADLLRSCNNTTDGAPDVPDLNARFIAIKEKHLKENVF